MLDGPLFDDRHDAGRQLAARLDDYRDEDPVVLGLARGGVVLGYEVARSLGAPLDVVVVCKVGAPGKPELGVGAVAPGVALADEHALHLLGLNGEAFEACAAEARQELDRRLKRYRGEAGLPDIAGRTVIVVDDGLATGLSARAAVEALRQRQPARIVLAVAVCAPRTADALAALVDDVVSLARPERFVAVGLWYRDFGQTTDEEVLDLLERARAAADSD